jgi:myo-inositol 2-dehydrogenase/D-chiro-inositol 1-dehydrogenase
MALRIGFAGAGFIAGVHAEVLAQLPDVEVAAFVDPDEQRSRDLASKTGARHVSSLEALLQECDALYICVPNALHARIAVEALEAGKHVFSEKPMATTLEDARRVHAAAQASEGVYQIGFNRRSAPVYQAVKERIDGGELSPRWAHMKMNRGDLQQPPWVADASLTGGFLYETPIHALDLAMWLLGPVEEVVARAAQNVSDQLDDFAMLFTFASGVTATFCSSAHTTWLFPFERVEVYGEHAVAVTDEMERVTFQAGINTASETRDVTHLPMPERWGYAPADEAFVAACRGLGPPAASADDALRSIELVDACYRAAASREAVRTHNEGRE